MNPRKYAWSVRDIRPERPPAPRSNVIQITRYRPSPLPSVDSVGVPQDLLMPLERRDRHRSI